MKINSLCLYSIKPLHYLSGDVGCFFLFCTSLKIFLTIGVLNKGLSFCDQIHHPSTVSCPCSLPTALSLLQCRCFCSNVLWEYILHMALVSHSPSYLLLLHPPTGALPPTQIVLQTLSFQLLILCIDEKSTMFIFSNLTCFTWFNDLQFHSFPCQSHSFTFFCQLEKIPVCMSAMLSLSIHLMIVYRHAIQHSHAEQCCNGHRIPGILVICSVRFTSDITTVI